MPASDRMLLASIHDVGPRFEREVDLLADRLTRLLGAPRFAMLVVPDHWDLAPLIAAPAFARRLRGWADAGIEMFVHGWRHRDDSAHRGWAGIKARYMTASEGEFLGLDEAEALRRMTEARMVVEDAIGRPATGFIAPAWLYGPGALAALPRAGFRLAEDHFRVWNPQDGTVLARGPVVTWASRSALRAASSNAFAALSRLALCPLPTLRIAVHPSDVGVPAIMRSIDATIGAGLRDRAAGRYADLT